MKSLSVTQESERQLTGQDIYWLVEIDFPSPTGTKYYSTRDITIEGRTYEGTLKRFPSLSKVLMSGIDQEGIADAAEIAFRNLHEETTRFEDLTLQHTMEGIIVRLRYIFKDQASSIVLADIIDAHVYRIDNWQATTQEVVLNLVDFSLALGEREIGRPITPEAFSKAPPESFDKIIPHIFGDCRDCELIPIDIGQETNLYGSITAEETVVKVDSVEDFTTPSGWAKLLIDEEVVYYNYINAATKEFGSTGSPCKRGQDSTVAREHSDRTKVQEIKDYYIYLVADHRCKLVDNVRVAGKPITNFTSSWYRLDDKDVQLLSIQGLPTYEEIMPIATFLTVSGEKDKDDQDVWLWEVGSSNNATDAANSFDVEGIFSFASIDKGHPTLHIKMLSNLSAGTALYGDLIKVRLGIEYYESQPHDEAKPPYVQLKKDGAFQNLRANLHNHVALKRASEQETEADNPDHPHDDDFEIGNLAPSTTRLRTRAIVYDIQQETGAGEVGIRIKSWPSGESALSGDSFSLSYSIPYYQYWPGMETAIYAALARNLYALWFEFPDVPYTNEQATIKKITVKVVAGQAPYPLASFSKRGFVILSRSAGDTSWGPPAVEIRGTTPSLSMGGSIPALTERSLGSPPTRATDAEARTSAKTFTFNMPIPADGWDYFKNIQWGIHSPPSMNPALADVYVLDSFIYRVYNIEVEIEYELKDNPYLTGSVLPYRNLIGEIVSNRAIQKINITKCVEANGGWAFFNETPEILINFNSTSSDVKIYILNVFFEFEYRAKTLRIGTGRVTADVQGQYSGATLYENPAAILWRILNSADYMGLNDSYLDADSFVATQTELTTHNYKFARRVTERISLRTLLAEAVWQSRSRLFFEGSKYYLNFREVSAAGLYSPGASVFTMDKNCILNPVLDKRRSETPTLANQIAILYDKNNNDLGFLRSHEITDAESKDRSWGLRRLSLEALWHTHNNSTVIADLAAFLVHLMAWKHTLVTIETPLLCAHLERGDIVLLDHPESELNTVPGEIIRTRRIGPARLEFMVDTVVASAYAYWYDVNNYISISPGRTMMYFVVEGVLVGTLDWKGNLKLRATYREGKHEVVGIDDPVIYIPGEHKLVFNRDRPSGGWRMLWFCATDTVPTTPGYLFIGCHLRTDYPITSIVTDYITNTEDGIYFAVDGVNVVAEYIAADQRFYIKGGIQTDVLL